MIIQGLSELADQNNTVKSSSSGNNRKNIFKNRFSLDFKIRTLLIDQSRVDIKLPSKIILVTIETNLIVGIITEYYVMINYF
jgi:hypothetical protein